MLSLLLSVAVAAAAAAANDNSDPLAEDSADRWIRFTRENPRMNRTRTVKGRPHDFHRLGLRGVSRRL